RLVRAHLIRRAGAVRASAHRAGAHCAVHRYSVRVHIDFSSSQRTSLGVEWELELVDLDTRQLISASDDVLATISPDGEHPKAKHELLQSCVEVITGICQTVAQAREDLAQTVAEVSKAAAERNIGLMCSGSHPITDWTTQRITDDA